MSDADKEVKLPSLEKTHWRISATFEGVKGGKDRFRFYEPTKEAALAKARELLLAGRTDVVIRDPASSAEWHVRKHPTDERRMSLIVKKTPKKPVRFQLWIANQGGHTFLLSVHKTEEEALKAGEPYGKRAKVKPVYE